MVGRMLSPASQVGKADAETVVPCCALESALWASQRAESPSES